MAIPYRTAKFTMSCKSANILAIAILGSIAKFNSHQYFRLYGILYDRIFVWYGNGGRGSKSFDVAIDPTQINMYMHNTPIQCITYTIKLHVNHFKTYEFDDNRLYVLGAEQWVEDLQLPLREAHRLQLPEALPPPSPPLSLPSPPPREHEAVSTLFKAQLRRIRDWLQPRGKLCWTGISWKYKWIHTCKNTTCSR